MSERSELWRTAREACEWAGGTIREDRRALNLTQQELADYVGTDKPTISRIENGRETPGEWTAERLERALQPAQRPANPPALTVVPRVRTTDPVSSQHALGDMAADQTTKDLVAYAIELCRDIEFTDTDLTRCVNQLDGSRARPRNIIAKYRGWAEEAGKVERVGTKPDASGRLLVHFRKAQP